MTSDHELLTLKRQVFWDMFDHDATGESEIQSLCGLMPASEEVLDMEHDASDGRLERIGAVYPRIKDVCALAGDLAAGVILNHLDEEEKADQAAMWAMVIAMGAVAVVADLVDKGFLIPTIPGGCVHV